MKIDDDTIAIMVSGKYIKLFISNVRYQDRVPQIETLQVSRFESAPFLVILETRP